MVTATKAGPCGKSPQLSVGHRGKPHGRHATEKVFVFLKNNSFHVQNRIKVVALRFQAFLYQRQNSRGPQSKH